jgi:hypothetical protein
MNERMIQANWFLSGTLSADVTLYQEFPWPVTYAGGKAVASNDSSATVALSGASTMSITADEVGDSGDPGTLVIGSTDVAYEAADSLITITVDYDGDGGTAAANVHLQLFFLTGED